MREYLPLRFLWRTEAIAALERVREGKGKATELEAVAESILHQAIGAVDGDPIWAYAELLLALAKAVPWKQLMRDGNLAYMGCQVGANTRAADAIAARQAGQWWPSALEEAAIALVQLASPTGVEACAEKLLAVPLPTRITGATLPDLRFQGSRVPVDPTVGPVSIQLRTEGAPLPTPCGLKPSGIHEVEVHATWPSTQLPQGRLRVRFEIDLPQDQARFPSVELEPGNASAKTQFQLLGSLEPWGAQREVEVIAELIEIVRGHPVTRRVRVIGHNRFCVMTYNAMHDRILTSPIALRKLMEMLAVLHTRIPGLPAEEVNDFATLYGHVVEFGQLAIREPIFPSDKRTSERAFQARLKEYLLPMVGPRLQEKSRMSGGEIDLMLGSITLELKVAHDKEVNPTNVTAWFRQPAFYGAGRGCPVTILCILDDSPKATSPGDLANYMRWAEPPLHGLFTPEVPALVAVLVIPVAFGPPHKGGKSPSPRASQPVRKSRSAKKK